MALEPNTRLGPYEILSAIGAGGMGEVYKAKDSRLDRTVAIKVLPSHLAENSELKERFQREAKAISQLNHANICTLHDVGSQDGVDFLVMELIEGETLADRLERGPLPLSEAIETARQIAAALEEAHRNGIVHRDLKPGNIVLTHAGVKLLDFGLAKLASTPLSEDSRLQTDAKPLTSQDAILGTFQYMAPEQLEGREADARTDLFAFDVVLYEMLTGKKAFEGKTQASLIARILEREPISVSTEQPLVPRSLGRILSRCLAKDPAHRWESARDVREVLSWVEEDASTDESLHTVERTTARMWLPWAVASGAIMASIAAFLVSQRGTAEKAPLAHFVLDLPEDSLFTARSPSRNLAISPDGEHLVYTGSPDLFLRRLGWTQSTSLAGGGTLKRDPFFSPDSEWLGFFDGAAWKKVSVRGGPITTLAGVPGGSGGSRGASWSENDDIVFASAETTTGLLLVSAAGGEPEVLTRPDTAAGELNHRWPEFLPGGEAVLFDVVGGSRTANPTGLTTEIVVLSLRTGERKGLIPGGSSPRYTSTGLIVYAAEGALRAVRFDPEKLELIGNAFPVVDGVDQKATGVANFAISSNGTLAYNPNVGGGVQRVLTWVDREGRTMPLPLPAATYDSPSPSPDGRQLALSMTDESGTNIWIYDLERGTLGKRTFGGFNLFPIWTPDGEELIYSSDAAASLARLRADGSSGGERMQIEGMGQGAKVPTSWSDVHRVMLFQLRGDTWKLSIDEESVSPFIEQEGSTEREARFSPDQNYVAYRSDETGRDEVYVVSFPGPGGKWQISREGGAQPMWAPAGDELFYKSGDRMMAVTVRTEPTFEAGAPRVLFESPLPERVPGDPSRYGVSADAQRFLITAPAPGDEGEPEIHVILNWHQELERLTPEN
jgi:serine/threonine-protein kinase